MPVAYQYDERTRKYKGEVERQKDPISSAIQEKDVWLLPANSTDIPPLKKKDGFDVVWDGTAWQYKPIPEPQPEPEPTQEEKEKTVRAYRDYLLAKYDFTQLSDAPLTAEEKTKYAEYRQYLRDYTKTENWYEKNPDNYEVWSNS